MFPCLKHAILIHAYLDVQYIMIKYIFLFIYIIYHIYIYIYIYIYIHNYIIRYLSIRQVGHFYILQSNSDEPSSNIDEVHMLPAFDQAIRIELLMM